MIILLVVTGLFLVFLEFFLPGGIMATGGALLLASSIIVMLIRKVSIADLSLFIGIISVSLYLITRIALFRVKKSKVCLDTDQEGFQACIYPKEMIGKKAIVSSDLKPAGYIQIEDRAFSALSKSGYIEKGSEVRIIGGDGASLIVVQEVHCHVSNASR